MAQERGHLQLSRADAIRSRLIDTFSLIEHLQGLSQAVPRHTLREMLDPSYQQKLMSGDQEQLVRFSIKPRRMGRITYSRRLLSKLRVRCSQMPPLSLWAGWVLESSIFSKFIISLIFLNTFVLMVEIELMESTNTALWPVKLALEVADWFILLSFIVEILLMWLASFFLFWKNAWNVFDFFVTLLSLLPELVVLLGVPAHSVWIQLLRVSRVLRSLKLFARFRQIKVILLALVRALKSMTFLLMLLLIFFYIFAVTGVYFFREYSRSTIEGLEYNMFFSGTSQGKVSEDIIETSDASDDDDDDEEEEDDDDKSDATENNGDESEESDSEDSESEKIDPEKDYAKKSYPEKSHPEKSYDEQTEAEKVKKESKEKAYPTSPSNSSHGSTVANIAFLENLDWETLVHENLPGLMDMDQDDRVVWPRDSLFRYFELLEKLQYNLEERKKLQEFAVQALMSFEDK
ncbi:cation channel sperm-associated protein 2 isoform X5 [Mus pahari]|uniref:cation channel sperm-associated protein 2 isoform X5 n=1 Tax=Mus pahari TaxID=10093 RepID=UPI0011148490|nr:cation channel sperm-associated protein 2 isoform X5 [Mus pahari]